MGIDKIEKIAEKGNASKLVRYTNSRDAAERLAAVTGMGKCKITEEAYNALIDTLRDPEVSVRVGAVQALQAQNQKNALEHIRHAFNDQSDPKLIAACKEAAAALADIHSV